MYVENVTSLSCMSVTTNRIPDTAETRSCCEALLRWGSCGSVGSSCPLIGGLVVRSPAAFESKVAKARYWVPWFVVWECVCVWTGVPADEQVARCRVVTATGVWMGECWRVKCKHVVLKTRTSPGPSSLWTSLQEQCYINAVHLVAKLKTCKIWPGPQLWIIYTLHHLWGGCVQSQFDLWTIICTPAASTQTSSTVIGQVIICTLADEEAP